MVPERNVLADSGLRDKQQSKWVADITDMMAEGPMAIMRLPKIRQAVVASPEPMLWFSKIRIKLEILYLELWNRCTKCSSENRVVDDYNDILQEIERRMGGLMVEVAQRMRVQGCANYDLWAI
ncbi:hypothetical protein DPMN_048673 [Dreissena polymorpha]|uniref:Uncharacterized protein n=1 Tax=Dreissena polymorpha TaxID=45954 RepID=A0A9D4DAF4_DREPO|nr:hypothetical protein DPMN_048673 [Dreissena polymorpha]